MGIEYMTTDAYRRMLEETERALREQLIYGGPRPRIDMDNIIREELDAMDSAGRIVPEGFDLNEVTHAGRYTVTPDPLPISATAMQALMGTVPRRRPSASFSERNGYVERASLGVQQAIADWVRKTYEVEGDKIQSVNVTRNNSRDTYMVNILYTFSRVNKEFTGPFVHDVILSNRV